MIVLREATTHRLCDKTAVLHNYIRLFLIMLEPDIYAEYKSDIMEMMSGAMTASST